jgi:Protein of unknown function (DUF2568)
MRSLNLAFRFALELLALLALFLLGMSLSGDFLVQLILALAMPALVIVVWALYVAPRASRRLPDPTRLVVESVIWLVAALAYLIAVDIVVAVLFAAAVVINLVLMFTWGQRGA